MIDISPFHSRLLEAYSDIAYKIDNMGEDFITPKMLVKEGWVLVSKIAPTYEKGDYGINFHPSDRDSIFNFRNVPFLRLFIPSKKQKGYYIENLYIGPCKNLEEFNKILCLYLN